MAKFRREDALDYHSQGRPSKIEVIPTKPYSTQRDLTLASLPASPSLVSKLKRTPKMLINTRLKVIWWLLFLMIAVLGLHDIGALASKPVMEGKGLLFKIFADIDVFNMTVVPKTSKLLYKRLKILPQLLVVLTLRILKHLSVLK